MNQVSTVGLDLAKHIFQLHGADSAGAVVFRKRLHRGQLLAFLATLPPCPVALEACGSAHYWGREIAKKSLMATALDCGDQAELGPEQERLRHWMTGQDDGVRVDAALHKVSCGVEQFKATRSGWRPGDFDCRHRGQLMTTSLEKGRF